MNTANFNNYLEAHSAELFIVILILFIPLSLGMLSNGQNWGGDFSAYLMQAHSLIDGTVPEFIRSNRYTIENSSRALGPIVYPWGYPLLIAPIYATFGFNLMAYKALNILLYLLFLICLNLLFKNHLPRLSNLALTAVFAFNPTMLLYLDNLLSDIPYLLCTILVFLLMDRLIVGRQNLGNQPGQLGPLGGSFVIGVMIFIAYLLRSSGVLFLFVLFFCQALDFINQRRKSSRANRDLLLVYSIPYASFLFLTVIFSILLNSDQSSYLALLDRLNLGQFTRQLYIFALQPANFFEIAPFPNLHKYLYIIFLPLFTIGLLGNLRKTYHFALFFGLTFSLHALWPFMDTRFIFPILPFYIFYIFKGGIWILGRLPSQIIESGKRFTTGFLLAGIITSFCVSLSLGIVNLQNGRDIIGPFDHQSAALFSYVNHSITPDSLVIFFKPRVFRLMTGRQAITLENCEDFDKADYLIDHKQHGESAINRFDCPERIQLIWKYENQNFIVYHVSTP